MHCQKVMDNTSSLYTHTGQRNKPFTLLEISGKKSMHCKKVMDNTSSLYICIHISDTGTHPLQCYTLRNWGGGEIRTLLKS
jgi:hypothetical protein